LNLRLIVGRRLARRRGEVERFRRRRLRRLLLRARRVERESAAEAGRRRRRIERERVRCVCRRSRFGIERGRRRNRWGCAGVGGERRVERKRLRGPLFLFERESEVARLRSSAADAWRWLW